MRRPGIRGRREAYTRYGSAQTPLTILGNLAWWVRADLGITIGTGVSAWADQSGNGVNFTQGTGAWQPAFVASAINGQPAVQGDGSDDYIRATWARAAPGTQPFYIWLVVKQVTWGSLNCIIGDCNASITSGFTEIQNPSTPSTQTYCISATPGTNSAGTIGSYFRHEMQFQDSTADYLRVGSTTVTGTSAGNSAGSGQVELFQGGSNTAGRHANVEIAEAFAFLGVPSAGQRAALDAYCTARYGAGLV